MEHVTLDEARDRLEALTERAHETGARIVVTRDGQPIAAIVHVEDAESMQGIEDRLDREAIAAARDEIARDGTGAWQEIDARRDGQRVSHALSG